MKYWLVSSQTELWRSAWMGFEIWNGMGESGVYVQNLGYLVVCTEKFVDSVLDCSWGGNVVGRMDE